MAANPANDDLAEEPLQHAIRLLSVLHAWYHDPNSFTSEHPGRLDPLYPGNQQKRNTGYYGNAEPLWLQVEKILARK